MEKVDKLNKRKIGLVFLIMLVVILLIFFLLIPRISLKGKTTIMLNINSEYKEPGYHASYLFDNLTDKVKVSGKVNNKKDGVYYLTYKVKGPFITVSTKRKVEVKDIERPVITLEGGNETYICPNSKYKELGYKASDNIDGDLTKKVKITEKENEVTYEVEDKAHNKTSVTRKIQVGDKMTPAIELTGGDIVFYVEPGYKATDNCDGDITGMVITSGSVDINNSNDQVLTYTVEDKSHNKTEAKRTIKMVRRDSPGTIYLTFDDGPNYGTTNVILDILKEENVKTTFFVTGKGPDELIKREYDEGHTVALHTFSHNYQTVYQSVDAYFNDLTKVHDRVASITGYDSRIIRFPGGSSNTISRHYQEGIMTTLTKEVIEKGYYYYDWNISSGDAGEYKDSRSIINQVTRNLSKERTNMVLMHDIKPYTRDALREIIKYGKENGYHFDKITTGTKMIRQKVNN